MSSPNFFASTAGCSLQPLSFGLQTPYHQPILRDERNSRRVRTESACPIEPIKNGILHRVQSDFPPQSWISRRVGESGKPSNNGTGKTESREKCVEKDTHCRGIVSGSLRGFAGNCRSTEGQKGIITGSISCREGVIFSFQNSS